MSGLRLGDIVLDPKGMIFLPQQKAIVCSGLKQTLSTSNIKSIKQAAACVELALQKYMPETVIALGQFDNMQGLDAIARKWGKKLSFIFVCSNPHKEVIAHAEALKLKFDIQQEFVWDKFRFIEKFEKPVFTANKTMNLQFTTIAGHSGYFVRIGKKAFDPLGLFSDEKLGVFLRGFGRILIPPLDTSLDTPPDEHSFDKYFDKYFDRYDVFAMGHSRILPLGKVLDLKRMNEKKGRFKKESLCKAHGLTRH